LLKYHQQETTVTEYLMCCWYWKSQYNFLVNKTYKNGNTKKTTTKKQMEMMSFQKVDGYLLIRPQTANE